ncbi:antibiotic biosynthesis monooxygenase [Chromohalobacter sp. 296-RDG]|uniref:antibiotic biosynthesis monooxygenase n=1 Tax=Chromohalobacter sp. 296-RDG TaxID=2994062 RepID=UPI0024685CA9|nr:antibiotic biosynthesis monooxygenase [Chromohalobacter sp. 296-RDG]
MAASEQSGLYLVETEWEDQDAFRAWVESDGCKQTYANPMCAEAFSEAVVSSNSRL